ncbi:uncharacterized protein LOC144609307 [Rhinoraja longicauda]
MKFSSVYRLKCPICDTDVGVVNQQQRAVDVTRETGGQPAAARGGCDAGDRVVNQQQRAVDVTRETVWSTSSSARWTVGDSSWCQPEAAAPPASSGRSEQITGPHVRTRPNRAQIGRSEPMNGAHVVVSGSLDADQSNVERACERGGAATELSSLRTLIGRHSRQSGGCRFTLPPYARRSSATAGSVLPDLRNGVLDMARMQQVLIQWTDATTGLGPHLYFPPISAMWSSNRYRIDTLHRVQYYFDYVITVVGLLSSKAVCVHFLTSNLVAIIVIGRGNCGLSRCITHYLVAMAAADLTAVFFNVAIHFLYSAIFRGSTHTVACTLQQVMGYVSLDCSVWLTVAFTFDRFVAICCQGFKTKYCTVRIARVAIATVYVVSLLRNIPYYFAFYSSYVNYPIGCLEMPEYFSHPGWLAFSWIHTILTPLVPFFVIVTLNILTVRSIVVASRVRRKLRAHASGEKQEDPEMQSRRKSIILLFCVSGSFILLWLTDVCFFIYTHIANLHQVQSYDNPRYFASSTAYMLKILSSCTNTFIYVLTQSKVRDELKNAIKYPFTICLKIVQK